MEDADKTEVFHRARGFVTLERYAEILALVVHFGNDRLSEILSRVGLSPQQWTLVDEAWTIELAEGKRRQQHEQADRFNRTFAQTRQRLATTQPRMEAIGTDA